MLDPNRNNISDVRNPIQEAPVDQNDSITELIESAQSLGRFSMSGKLSKWPIQLVNRANTIDIK